jgi:hypothetical protein
MSWMYGGERVDARALDELEVILRAVGEELAAWRVRALKAEADVREGEGGGGGGGGSKPGPARPDPELRNRLADLESENKTLRQRVEAARARAHDLLGRLAFLEEQTREPGIGRGAGR